jgi:serine/threonine-protein kinase
MKKNLISYQRVNGERLGEGKRVNLSKTIITLDLFMNRLLFPMLMAVSIIIIFFSSCTKPGKPAEPENYIVTTLAGKGVDGFADGSGITAIFYGPKGIATDVQGNIYVADIGNNRIRKISASGTVSTLAGNGIFGYVDGSSSMAQFTGPDDVATDALGNVYVTESNHIRKITRAGEASTLTGGITGHVDGDLSTAQFGLLAGITTDAQNNIYVIDWGGNSPNFGARIRKITPAGIVSTLAGNDIAGYIDGNGTAAQFLNPTGITTDPQGNVYVADYGNRRVRKITAAGVVSTLASIGSSPISGPSDVAADSQGNIYVIQSGLNQSSIYMITASGTSTVVAGSTGGYADGAGSTALFKGLLGIALDAQGNIYVSDYTDSRIRKISKL